MTSISILDLGLGVLALLFLVRGILRGMLREVAGIIGIFLGLVLAGRFYPQLVPQFTGILSNERWSAGLSYAIIFILTLLGVAIVVALIRRFMNFTMTAWVDTLLGGVAGLLKGVFACAIVIALMQHVAPDSPFLKNAMVPEYINPVISFARSFFPKFMESMPLT